MLSRKERQELRILWIVVAGFFAGIGLLFFLIATDV